LSRTEGARSAPEAQENFVSDLFGRFGATEPVDQSIDRVAISGVDLGQRILAPLINGNDQIDIAQDTDFERSGRFGGNGVVRCRALCERGQGISSPAPVLP
jgi:hypothetical protein